MVAPAATDHEALTNARSQIGRGCSAILGGSALQQGQLQNQIWLGAALVHSVLKAGSEIYATGVLTIRCNVQASCEARQRSLVSFGLFRGPMEQLMGGAWRLHTSSAVRLDFPNRLGAAKAKPAPTQQRRHSFLVLRHTRAMGRVRVKGEEGQLQQTSRST